MLIVKVEPNVQKGHIVAFPDVESHIAERWFPDKFALPLGIVKYRFWNYAVVVTKGRIPYSFLPAKIELAMSSTGRLESLGRVIRRMKKEYAVLYVGTAQVDGTLDVRLKMVRMRRLVREDTRDDFMKKVRELHD